MMKAQFFSRCPLFAAGLLLLANPDATAATDQTSGFDVDTENWRGSDVGATLAWQATGGATGAHLKATGPGAEWHLLSPSAWAGDWSAYRALKFDLAITSRHYADADRAAMVGIAGANSATMTWHGPTPLWTWTHYEVGLDPQSFGVDQATFDGIMAEVAEATFQGVMSYANKLQVRGEFDSGNDLLWLDNVTLATGPVVPRVFETSLTSRFGGDAEDWTVFDGATLGWDATGGFTGAAITSHDDGTGTARFCSPDAWSGDWRGFQSLKFMR